ncbi:hypothetical protein FGO68_gene12901 [Halteria grandinella]|uniref:FYVE-type domain-containing protein n=1 Tax=Halteria grandinella TaxID=5974 RepID=A0A8J8T6Q2_HALGN|nr:hypothetical protein FGO68_gene12901 [Halteria grandinella]
MGQIYNISIQREGYISRHLKSCPQHRLKSQLLTKRHLSQHSDMNLLMRIDQLEEEMRDLINKNQLLSQIVKNYQFNLSRLTSQIDGSLSNLMGVVPTRQSNNPANSVYMKRKQLLNESTHLSTDPNQQKSQDKRKNRFNSVLEQAREPADLDEPVRLADIDEESADSGELEISAFHENLVKTLDMQVHQIVGILGKVRGIPNGGNGGMNQSMTRLGSSSRYSKRSRTPSAMNVKYISPNIGGGTGSTTLQLVHHHSSAQSQMGQRESVYSTPGAFNQNSPPHNDIDTQNEQQLVFDPEIISETNNNEGVMKGGQKMRVSSRLLEDGSGRGAGMVHSAHLKRGISTQQLHGGGEGITLDPLSPANNSMSYSMTRGTTGPFNNATGGLLDQTVGSGTLLPPPSTSEPMKWVPNERFDGCVLCGKLFGIFRRKHHCRSCGSLVCQQCSPDKEYVQGYKDVRVRVCKQCTATKVKRQAELKTVNIFISAANQVPQSQQTRQSRRK